MRYVTDTPKFVADYAMPRPREREGDLSRLFHLDIQGRQDHWLLQELSAVGLACNAARCMGWGVQMPVDGEWKSAESWLRERYEVLARALRDEVAVL